jgi:hypothetical protein
MNTMAPTRLAELQSVRVWPAAGTAAVPEARGHVRAAIRSWDVPADAETGRGLLLVATLSAEWGFYRTATGKAVYFTLACPAEPVLSELPIPRQARN